MHNICRLVYNSRTKHAFTLIELLIVVAIIGVLSAIAVPNFLQAQTRAKVGVTLSDLRALATAVESYRGDWNYYPLPGAVMLLDGSIVYPMPVAMHSAYSHNFLAGPLTTPVDYITQLPLDPFIDNQNIPLEERYYYYQSFEYTKELAGGTLMLPMQYRYQAFGEWVMFACGPDQDRKDMAPALVGPTGLINAIYDPTNGTISNGDIIRTQRSAEGPVI